MGRKLNLLVKSQIKTKSKRGKVDAKPVQILKPGQLISGVKSAASRKFRVLLQRS